MINDKWFEEITFWAAIKKWSWLTRCYKKSIGASGWVQILERPLKLEALWLWNLYKLLHVELAHTSSKLRVPWTARRFNQSILKELSPEYSWKDWCWSWNSNTLATWCRELTHLKRPWCWEGMGAGGEGDNRGWDGWMTSPTRWTWIWVNSGSWWWTGRPGSLQIMARKESDMTERLNWTEP